MLIKPGAKVYSSDNQPVGTLSHIILYPGTREITHFLVQGGSGTARQMLVPFDDVSFADDRSVVLGRDAQSLASPATPDSPASDRELRHGGEVALSEPVEPAGEPAAQPFGTLDDRPEGTVVMKGGAKVITSDGQNVGDVDYFTTAGRQLNDIFITKGSLLKKHRLIQSDVISSVKEDEIRLTVDADFVNSLPEPRAGVQPGAPG